MPDIAGRRSASSSATPGTTGKLAHGRPRLEPGTHGAIRTRAMDGKRTIPPGQVVPKGVTYRSRCQLRLHDGTTVDVEATGSSKTKAEKALADRCHKLLGTTRRTRLSGRSPFAEVAEMWLRDLQAEMERDDISPTTWDLYRQILRRYVMPALGNLELHEIDVACLQDLFVELRDERKLGLVTLQHVKLVISHVLYVAVSRGALKHNPCKELARFKARRGQKKLPRALEPYERADLLAKLRNDPGAVRSGVLDMVLFQLGTGARLAEMLAVKWADITEITTIEGGTPRTFTAVLLGPTVVTVVGKGLVYRARGKTGATDETRRVVPLPAFVVDMLARRRPEWATDDSPVFWSATRGHRSTRTVSRAWREIRARIGYDWVTTHVFRKTAATEWRAMGLDDVAVADLAGHTDPNITRRVYFGRNRVHPEAVNRTGYEEGSGAAETA